VIHMGDLNFTPVPSLLFGLCATIWLVLVGWVGWRWLIKRWRWPWPIVGLIQGVLASQIYWLLGLMSLNLIFPPQFLTWLQVPGSMLFWLVVFPWFSIGNLIPLTPLGVSLRLPYPEILDLVLDYGLIFAAINAFLIFKTYRSIRN
jgi:hypothetical protein